MKCNQCRPGFELVSPCPFPTTITTTPWAPPFAGNRYGKQSSNPGRVYLHFTYLHLLGKKHESTYDQIIGQTACCIAEKSNKADVQTYNLLLLLPETNSLKRKWIILVSSHFSIFANLVQGNLKLFYSRQFGARPEPRATCCCLLFSTCLCWLYNIPDHHAPPVCYLRVAREHVPI